MLEDGVVAGEVRALSRRYIYHRREHAFEFMESGVLLASRAAEDAELRHALRVRTRTHRLAVVAIAIPASRSSDLRSRAARRQRHLKAHAVGEVAVHVEHAVQPEEHGPRVGRAVALERVRVVQQLQFD